jgi:alpha-galactosidase
MGFAKMFLAGSLDWEENDAKRFAGWGVDYLKYDNCYHMGRFGTPKLSFDRYKVMWDAINSTGRPMLYSLCNWGEDYTHTVSMHFSSTACCHILINKKWGMSIANSWRMSGDIYDSFTRPDDLCACTDASSPFCVAPGSHCSVLNIINKVAPYVDRGQPGGWNDLDMLEVGNGGMTDEEVTILPGPNFEPLTLLTKNKNLVQSTLLTLGCPQVPATDG